MKINELKILSEENLKVKLNELKKELIILNSKRARGSTLEKPALIKNTRRTIARILTISKLNELKKDSGKGMKKNE